jgi:hypothetical protein
MVRLIFIIITLIIMLSCASNNDYSILKNESTKVPKEKAYFKNIYVSCTQLVNRTSNQIKVDFQL